MSAPVRYHIVVCRGPECGGKRCSEELQTELELLVETRGLSGRVKLDRQSCFGRCLSGPNIMVREAHSGDPGLGGLLPGASGDAVLYNAVRIEEIGRILDEHVLRGRPIRAMLNRSPTAIPKVADAKDTAKEVSAPKHVACQNTKRDNG